MSCPVNNLAFVIPSEAKESFCEIAASLKLLAMTKYRSARDMTLASQDSFVSRADGKFDFIEVFQKGYHIFP